MQMLTKRITLSNCWHIQLCLNDLDKKNLSEYWLANFTK